MLVACDGVYMKTFIFDQIDRSEKRCKLYVAMQRLPRFVATL